MHFEANTPYPSEDRCFFVVKRLSDYFEQRCPDWLRAQLQGHLTSCPSCREKLREIEVVRLALQEMPSHTFHEKTLESLVDKVNHHPSISRPTWLSLELVAGVSLVIVLILAFPRLKPQITSWTSALTSWTLSRPTEPAASSWTDYATPLDDLAIRGVFFEDVSILKEGPSAWNPGPRKLPDSIKIAPSLPPSPQMPTKIESLAKIEPPLTHQPLAKKIETRAQPEITATNRESFGFNTFIITSTATKDELHAKALELLKMFGAQQAGKSTFGEILNGGLYYHFTISQADFAKFREQLKSVGVFSERRKESQTPVGPGLNRIALWIGFSK